jgi:hypothetical protein
MSYRGLLTIALVLAVAYPGCGEEIRPGDTRSGALSQIAPPRVPGEIERALFAPDLVLAQGHTIALSADQRAEIAQLTISTQAALDAHDRELDSAIAVLAETLAASPIDEEAAITAARAVTVIEGDIKLVHLRMLVRVRNALTDEQRAQLSALVSE